MQPPMTGGVGSRVERLTKHLSALGHEVRHRVTAITDELLDLSQRETTENMSHDTPRRHN